MAVVCSQLHTIPLSYCLPSVLISQPPFSHHKEIVLLDPLPWLICHPAAALLQSRTAGAEKRKQYKQAGAGHNIKCASFTGPESLASSLFFQESRKVNMPFLLCGTPPNFRRLTNFFHLSSLLDLNVLFCIVLSALHPATMHILNHPRPLTVTCYSRKYRQCSQCAVSAPVTSL